MSKRHPTLEDFVDENEFPILVITVNPENWDTKVALMSPQGAVPIPERYAAMAGELMVHVQLAFGLSDEEVIKIAINRFHELKGRTAVMYRDSTSGSKAN